MTYVEDRVSGVIIVVPDGDALARERVLGPKPRREAPRAGARQDLISRLFPRKAPAQS